MLAEPVSIPTNSTKRTLFFINFYKHLLSLISYVAINFTFILLFYNLHIFLTLNPLWCLDIIKGMTLRMILLESKVNKYLKLKRS